jgi:hypothetical protein
MNKIVGGLLVVTLLSNPSIMKFDFLAYTIYKAETVIITGVKKEQERIEQAVTSSDVDGILSDIDKNTRSIRGLLKDKYNLISKIQSIMNLKAYTKTVMSDYQIDTFQKFNRYYEIESKNLTETLDNIENEKIATAKWELLKTDASFQTVYQELKLINDSQYDAIYNLSNIIERGTKTLAII